MTPREIDKIIGEKVMGLQGIREADGPMYLPQATKVYYAEPKLRGAEIELPYYSTDIAAAWSVVEKICSNYRLGYDHLILECLPPRRDWICRFAVPDALAYGQNCHKDGAETAPMAICLAALRALR